MSLFDVILDPTEASKDKQELRKSVCDSCERKSKLGLCKECKCVVSLKVLFEVESCPLKKWI